MNSKKHSVFEDLLELSQLADNVIEKALSESAFDESFFEETKMEIYKILLNKSPAKKKKSQRKSCFFRPKKENILDPFLEIRAHVHKKPNSESLERSTIPTNSIEELVASNKIEISNISFFSNSKVKMLDVLNKKIPSSDSWDESCHQSKLDSESNSEIKFEKYSTPYDSNVCRSTYRKMSQKVKSNNIYGISPISNEFNANRIRKEETIIISSEGDNSTSENDNIENIDILSEGKSLSSEAVNGEIKATLKKRLYKVDTFESNLNKTFTLSSDSNKESINTNSLSSSSEVCCDCSALSFMSKKRHTKKECQSLLQDLKGSSKSHSSITSSGYVSGNPFDENTREKFPENLKVKKPEKSLVNDQKSTKPGEQAILNQCQNKISGQEGSSSEINKLSFSAFEEPQQCIKKGTNIHPEKLFLTKNMENMTTFENQSLCSEKKKSSSSSQSLRSLSSDTEKSQIQENKSKDIEIVNTEHCERKFSRKYNANKEQSNHFRVYSAPVNRKVTAGRNFRPKTPIDFMNSNYQSLKVKAEEQRKQREIRVQRTKERRERLEREREERMFDSEQRLKKRFQLHEEMLKQKTKTFKIKSRIREQRYSKRSVASTSSKDSKEDRTKDNDDFCRNAVNSGQKLYKESNGNCDVTPGESDLVSLDGTVGLKPEVSLKEKAIRKNCEQTPVEFPVYSDNAITADTISLKKGKKLKFQIGSEQVNDHTSPNIFKPLKHYGRRNMLSQTNENKSSNIVETKKILDHQDNLKCISQCAKGSKIIDKVSNEVSKSCNSKISQNAYSLRSAMKLKKGKLNNTTDFSQSKGYNSKRENSGCAQVNAKKHKIVRNSSETEKLCTNLCFKMNKNKLKKGIKAPRKKVLESNACKSLIKPTKGKKYRLYDSSKESERADKLPDKTQKAISCEIPEEVDDNSEDSIDDSTELPLWATGVFLKQALIQQFYYPPNLENIFGVLPKEPVNLAAFFGKDKPSYHQRTSSENWSLNKTPE